MTRDWTKTLLPASFKGYPFFVETENLDNGGRRVVTHEYVRGENHDTEDMGRKSAHGFTVKAYLASDGADADAATFLSLLSSQGPGMLSLPVLGIHLANCTEVGSSSEKTKLGYVGFNLKFVKASEVLAFPNLPVGARVAFSLAGQLASAITSTLSDPFTGMTAEPRAVLARGAEIATAAAVVIDQLPTKAIREAGTDPQEYDLRVIRSAIGRSETVEALGARVLAISTFVHDHAAVAMADEMQTASITLAVGLRGCIPATSSPTLSGEQRLGKRIVQGLSLFMVAEAAAASAARSFTSRTQANAARAAVLSAFDGAVSVATDTPEAVLSLAREVVATAIAHIDDTAGNLAPLVRIGVSKSMPSTALAWALYRDPARAPDLVQAAQTGTSLFMPTNLIAAAR